MAIVILSCGLSWVGYWGVMWIRVAFGSCLRVIGRAGRGWLALRPRHPAAQVLHRVECISGPHYPMAYFREDLLAYMLPLHRDLTLSVNPTLIPLSLFNTI